MRIVHVTNAARFDGTGLTNSTIDLAVEHAARGHEVAIVCNDADSPMRRFLGEHRVGLLEGVGTRSSFDLLSSLRTLRRAIADADVIHVHTVRSLALLAAASPAALLRQSVATLHNPHQRSSLALLAARRAVVLSEVQAEHVRRATGRLGRPIVIQNGTLGSRRRVSMDRIRTRRLSGRPIVFAGALHRRKGIDVLLRAMPLVAAEHPDVRLHVLGNRDAPEVEALAAHLDLGEAVIFEGYVADPREFMRAAEVFVLPSREEGFGNVLTEAREAGVAIVATRVGGIPEALDGGSAGMLVQSDDPDSLARALCRVLGDEEFRKALQRAAGRGLERLRVERAADDYEVVYRSVGGS